MSAAVWGGPIKIEGDRDDEGHRTYKISHLIKVSSYSDGPATVMSATGLPNTGSFFSFGNDTDIWAFCLPSLKIRPYERDGGEPGEWWTAEQIFTTRPINRCQDESIEDPLLEPAKVSGSFSRYSREITRDRDGNRIETSSFEPIRGQAVEFDSHTATVRIEKNFSSLGLETFVEYMNSLNDAPLWGLSAGKVKLSNVTWSRNYYGTCSVYYTRTYDFDIDFRGFDRRVPDEGTKVLSGQWNPSSGEWELINIAGSAPDPTNPSHFIQYKDRNGENAPVMLNGAGLPAETSVGTGSTGDIGEIEIKGYELNNLLQLGIPTSL